MGKIICRAKESLKQLICWGNWSIELIKPVLTNARTGQLSSGQSGPGSH